MEKPSVVAETLAPAIASFYGILRSLLEDPSTDPVVMEAARVWVRMVNGRSLLEAVAILFAGVIALKAKWEEAVEETEGDNLLTYASLPEILVN